MTSEPDGRPGRRAPTIDLKATEIEQPGQADASGGAASSSGESPQQNEPRPAGGVRTHLASGVVGAVAMAILGAGLWYGGYLPISQSAPSGPASSAPAAPPVAASAASTATPPVSPEIAARLDKIEAAIHAQRPTPADSALVKGLAAQEAETKALGESLAALGRRVDEIAGTSESAAKQAQAAQTAADAAKNANQSAAQTTVQKRDLGPLADHVATLERAVAALSESAAHPIAGKANDQAVRLTVAAEALRGTVERGAPYRAELDAVIALGADRSQAAPLEEFAATGIPAAPALAHELSALIPALERATDTASGDQSFLDRIESQAKHLVRITPVNAPAGNDPAAVVGRLKIDAARTDITAGITDAGALPDAAKPLAADWLKKAQTREATIAASRRIAAASLAALTKPVTQ